ncbi:MAG: 50S ribosomal protein L9 [Deltaproteobacteria bacterium CG23_combo_of_CG06-09_8_20_14_all_60_8]|nr:MAG: 50S ribosomal protein L9 [Desulfobacterales bacterium CG2_30_60_27]PIP43942.1 MAG: 50S ribosomal protein L9 [Deltaproteobacteria bacterium CG23_combo_of_CG06-09_8_20_14_all_60_8]
MEVILKETIETLGEEGDIVKVKPGYARNYLFPANKALFSTKANKAILAQEQASIEARKAKQREEAEQMAKKIAGATVVIAQRVGEENKLYGSITSADIAEKLAALGIDIDKKRIQLTEPIRTLGETSVLVKIAYQTTAEIKVQVVPIAAE